MVPRVPDAGVAQVRSLLARTRVSSRSPRRRSSQERYELSAKPSAGTAPATEHSDAGAARPVIIRSPAVPHLRSARPSPGRRLARPSPLVLEASAPPPSRGRVRFPAAPCAAAVKHAIHFVLLRRRPGPAVIRWAASCTSSRWTERTTATTRPPARRRRLRTTRHRRSGARARTRGREEVARSSLGC